VSRGGIPTFTWPYNALSFDMPTAFGPAPPGDNGDRNVMRIVLMGAKDGRPVPISMTLNRKTDADIPAYRSYLHRAATCRWKIDCRRLG
jgi:hypothetical protein